MALILHPDFQLYEKNDRAFCSSLQVAEVFEKSHAHVLRDIASIGESKSGLADNVADFFKHNFIRTSYSDAQAKKRPMFLMTKDGFTLLVMGYTGEKAMRFKVSFIKRFNDMEAFIMDYLLSKDENPIFTLAVSDAHDEPKNYHFSNEYDMINRIVLGLDAKHFRELHGLQDGYSIRPLLNPEQLKAVKKLQCEDVRLLYRGVDFQERKRLLTALSQKLITSIPLYLKEV